MLTALAAIITAFTSLLVALNQAGLLHGVRSSAPRPTPMEARDTTRAPVDVESRASAPSVPSASVPAARSSIDNPAAVAFGVIQRVSLDGEEDAYFRLSSPARELKIVLDMRADGNKRTNLKSHLSVLDEHGAVLQKDAIVFNQIDVDHRKVASLSMKQPAVVGLKLRNGRVPADFWLTVLRPPTTGLLPLFGDVVPKPLRLGESASGTLDRDEYAYHQLSASRGAYTITLDLATADRRSTNIQGYLALLDADGGNQREIARINEIDVSFREVTTISLRTDEPAIIRIRNDSGRVDYRLQVKPGGSRS